MPLHSNKKCNKKLFNGLIQKKKDIIKKYKKTYITQKDFNNGSYIIDKSGHYVLKENIVFHPNPENDFMPYPYQTQYTQPYFLGFFAAIVIQTKDVYLNLNGFEIKQSEEHALQQRYYANIELASSPFIPNQGPGNFGSPIVSAEDCIIQNGKLGRSSHHGIHGNVGNNILLEKLQIYDFEFVGIALNGGDSHVLNKINIGKNFQNVPVLATYSAARFIRQFAEHVLKHYEYKLTSEQITELKYKLKNVKHSLHKCYKEIMCKGYTTDPLFKNKERLPDGNVFGVVLHPIGVAIHDFVSHVVDYHTNVYLNCVVVKDLRARVDEIVTLSQKDGTGKQVDTAGSVLHIDNITHNGVYKGNVLSELQLCLADIAKTNNIVLGTINITKDVVNWSKNGENISTILDMGYKYQYSMDSMFHVNKGVLGYRFGGVKHLTMKNCRLYNIYNGAHSSKHKHGYYMGSQTHGINFAYCKDVSLCSFKSKKIISKNGDAVGINVMNDSDVKLYKIYMNYIKSLTRCHKYHKYKGYGIKIDESSNVKMKDIKICNTDIKIQQD